MPEDNRKLDEEFDSFLAEMKPFVLKLVHKSERQRCALWIKKLCEEPGHGSVGRKNRNMYSKLLLHMLKKGLLEGPFSSRPDPGPLPTLPSYTSIYFDEPTQAMALRREESGGHSLPDWVSGELWSSRESNELRSSVRSKVKSSSVLQERQINVQTTHNSQNSRALRLSGTGDGDVNPATGNDSYQSHLDMARAELRNRQKISFAYSSDEDEDPNPRRKEAKSTAAKDVGGSSSRQVDTVSYSYDWKKFESDPIPTRKAVPSGPTSLTASTEEDGMLTRHQDKHLEMRTKLLEAKFHEEKLVIQQRHDEAIQKILDRKNAEMDEMKTHYRTKVRDLEESNRKLERKFQNLTKESNLARESRDKQIAELRKMVEHSSQSTLNDYEKKLHDALADFEQEKFEMQKRQTSAIQDILEDTNSRLQKMETEYNAQVESHAEVIRELEAKVHQLTQESASHRVKQTQLLEEKSELDQRTSLLSVELENITKRYLALEKELETKKSDSERELRNVCGKSEATVEFLKEEHTAALAKLTDSNRQLEDKLHEMKQALQDSDLNRQRQVRELEAEYKQDKLHQEQLNERKLQGLRSQMEMEKQEADRQLRQAQNANQDKDEQIKRLKEVQRLQSQQAERALEDFKKQVEHNSARMFDDMKIQITKVEADLMMSKELREKQAQEYNRQMEEDRRTHQQQLSELELTHQRERADLLQQYQDEKDKLEDEHTQLLETTRENLEQRLQLVESRSQEQQQKDMQTISGLERQLRELREEMLQSESLRKQQLVELGLLREEERQKVQREHDAEVRQLRSEMDQYRTSLQKEHSAQMEHTLQQTIKEQQHTIDRLKEEATITKGNMELQLQDTVSKLEDEKELLMKQNQAYSKALQKELDDTRHRIRQMERKVQQQELDHQEKMLQLRQDYEQKARGLLPSSIKQELEATIGSLKSQVMTLQQRVLVLQEELDMRNRHITRFSPDKT